MGGISIDGVQLYFDSPLEVKNGDTFPFSASVFNKKCDYMDVIMREGNLLSNEQLVISPLSRCGFKNSNNDTIKVTHNE
ncbi:hypothetical protein [Providencia sp. Me31A]|uniref:hypothetical protein n=1 Tax=Providencia sp. Me31A TaxID=3392637 RepID=UPI003D294E9C